MKSTRILSGILLSAAFLTACGGKPETPASQPAAPASGVPPSAPAASDPAVPSTGAPNPAAAPATTGAAALPDPAVAAAARAVADQERASVLAEVAKFTLTSEHVDKISRVDTALAEFWANPTERARIRSSPALEKVLAEIEKTPVFVKALAAEKISARDYILGTFAMIGGYSYVVVVAQNPEAAKQGPPPVNAATLEVVKKRLNDIERIVRPPAR
ncbi:MAG: hypothetical protein JNK60_13265 [Acidobacteria bacterium]|nr:hypothetical protein [Acidobacteriota bacterium]